MTSPADAISDAVRAVTKEWAKQRKAEECSIGASGSCAPHVTRS